MNTAHLKNKKILLTTSLFVLTTILLTNASGVLAQSISNPFVPDSTEAPQTETVVYDETDANRTIAQDQVALTAIPPRLGDDGSIKAAPGEKVQVQLRVRNITEQPVSVLTSVQDFILAADGETPVPIDDSVSNRWSLASWLTITPTEHQIAAKSTVGVNVLIEIPEDALPGGHYAMVLHEPTNGSEDGKAVSTAINQRVGTLLYVIVDGPINEEAYIRDFSIPQFSEYGPVPFEFVVENNSDVHITPQMSVEIFNIFNQKIETIPVEAKNIFPLTSRDFSGQWDRVWGWGLYNARLTMSYGSAGAIVVANASFWLLPLKVIIALIVLLLVIIFIWFAVKRHLNHRMKMDEKRIEELETQIEEMQSQGDKENSV